jgi:hypothetical protein
MSSKTKTMEEIVLGLKVSQNPGATGTPLKIEQCNRERALGLQVDRLYQRLISPVKLTDYGTLDYTLLVPVVVSRRPKSLGEKLSGERIIDGQNKVAKFILSKETDGLTLAILEHDEDATYEEVLNKEALVFNRLNTWRKKLTTIDNLRSEVCFGDELAIHIENVMKTLNIVAEPDTFGSDKSSAFPIKSFTHFYYCVKDDYPVDEDGTLSIVEGYALWKSIYGDDKGNGVVDVSAAKFLHGTAFRAVCFLKEFIEEGLSNGKQKKFREWCIQRIPFIWTQAKLVKGFGSFAAPRWILYRIIDKYNEEISVSGTGAQTLGPVTLLDAAKVNASFAHPDEDEWKRIIVASTQPHR